MAVEALLWQVQGFHERIMRIVAAAEREITATDPQNVSFGVQTPQSPLRAPGGSHVASVLVRTRRNLNIQLIDERKALRGFALSVGVPENKLPPAFDKTCRFVPSHEVKPSPTQTPLQKDSNNHFEVRALSALKQRLTAQLSGLLRAPVQFGVTITSSDVIHPSLLTQALTLQNDIEKVSQRLKVATGNTTTPVAQTPFVKSMVHTSSPASTSFASPSHNVTVDLDRNVDALAVRKRLFAPTPDSAGKLQGPEQNVSHPFTAPVGEQSRIALTTVQQRLAALVAQQASTPVSQPPPVPPRSPHSQDKPAFSGLDRLFNKIFSGASPEQFVEAGPVPQIDASCANECEEVPEISPVTQCSHEADVMDGEVDSDGGDDDDGDGVGIDHHMAPARAAVAAAVAAANSFSEYLSTSGRVRQYTDVDVLSPGKVEESGGDSDIDDEGSFSVSSELNASEVSEPEPVGSVPIAIGRPRLIVPSTVQSPVKSLKEHRPVISFDLGSPVDMASPPPLPRVASRLRQDGRVSSYPPPYPAPASEFSTPSQRGQSLGTAVESPIGASPLSPMRPGEGSIMFLEVDASFLLTPQRRSPQPS